MLKDMVLMGISAVFGLGATLMSLAAPQYFPNAPSSVWHWFFWGGIALMVLMIIDAGILFFVGVKFLRFGPAVLANIALFALVPRVVHNAG